MLNLRYNNEPVYRLGETGDFQIREGGTLQQPALIFESDFIKVTEEFTFIVTPGSTMANGVKIKFTLENKSGKRIDAGIRFLLDTKLGESSSTPFTTDTRNIEEETLMEARSLRDQFWVSGNADELVLMGSLSTEVDRVPDMVHIANWQRLNEVPWSFEPVSGRKFNNPPYSIRDSAVAYYYQPVRINKGESSSFYLLLSSWDNQGFTAFRPSDGLAPRNLAIQAMQAAEAALARITPRPAAPVSPVPARTRAASPGASTGSTAQTASGVPGNTGTALSPQVPGGTTAAGTAPATATAAATATATATADNTGVVPSSANQAILRSDYNALRDMVERLERSIESGAQMSDDEITAIEQDLIRIRSRYANP
jgi:hypothetical protein